MDSYSCSVDYSSASELIAYWLEPVSNQELSVFTKIHLFWHFNNR